MYMYMCIYRSAHNNCGRWVGWKENSSKLISSPGSFPVFSVPRGISLTPTRPIPSFSVFPCESLKSEERAWGVRLMPNYMQPWVYMMTLLTYDKGETHQMKMVLNSLQVALHKEEWSLLEKWWPSSWGRLRHRKFYLHLLLCTQLLALSPEPLRCSAWYYSTKSWNFLTLYVFHYRTLTA